MRLKITEQGGMLCVSIVGANQEVVVCEDGCGFTIELLPSVSPSQVQTAQIIVSDDDVFGKLCTLRKELAVANGVPPYVIFHDKTLHAMADKLPADMEALGSLVGVGKAKLDKYGEAFLSVING